jgi:hypothetical protein
MARGVARPRRSEHIEPARESAQELRGSEGLEAARSECEREGDALEGPHERGHRVRVRGVHLEVRARRARPVSQEGHAR